MNPLGPATNQIPWAQPSIPAGFYPIVFSHLENKNFFFKNFNFWIWLKIGPNASPGPTHQFPQGFRPLYFHTLRKKKIQNFNFWFSEKLGPNESPGTSHQFRQGFKPLYFPTLTTKIFFQKFQLLILAKNRSKRIPWDQPSIPAGS